MKVAMILPGCSVFSELVITPSHTRSMTASEIISECTPRLRRSLRLLHTTSGSAPIPICRVAPSSIKRRRILPGPALRVVGRAGRHLRDWAVDLDHVVDVGDVDHAVPVEPGHRRVDLGDHRAAHLGGPQRVVHRDAQAAVPVLIGRGDADKSDVGRDVCTDNGRHLAEEAGHEVAPAFVHRDTGARGAEERDVADAVGDLGTKVRRTAEDEHGAGPDAPQLTRAASQRLHEGSRLAARVGHHDHVARPHGLHSFGGRGPASGCVVHRDLRFRLAMHTEDCEECSITYRGAQQPFV